MSNLNLSSLQSLIGKNNSRFRVKMDARDFVKTVFNDSLPKGEIGTLINTIKSKDVVELGVNGRGDYGSLYGLCIRGANGEVKATAASRITTAPEFIKNQDGSYVRSVRESKPLLQTRVKLYESKDGLNGSAAVNANIRTDHDWNLGDLRDVDVKNLIVSKKHLDKITVETEINNIVEKLKKDDATKGLPEKELKKLAKTIHETILINHSRAYDLKEIAKFHLNTNFGQIDAVADTQLLKKYPFFANILDKINSNLKTSKKGFQAKMTELKKNGFNVFEKQNDSSISTSKKIM